MIIVPSIQVHGLVKRYGEVLAVDGLDLDIMPGECFGLLGPNGAGKTTTVEVLEGLMPPTAGSVSILGRPWGHDAWRLRQRIGISLQETQFPDRLTVLETLRLFRSFYQDGQTPARVLEQVGLVDKADAWVMRLSGGQRQRLAIGCALVGDPEVLFLDEPTTGLDPVSRRDLWDIVQGLKARGRTVLLTTHYMDEAERLCDRVAIVDHGRIIAQGTPAELIGRLGAAQVIELSTTPPLNRDSLAVIQGVRSVSGAGDGWRLAVDAIPESLPPLLDIVRDADVTLAALATHGASLEDVFVALTGRTLHGPKGGGDA